MRRAPTGLLAALGVAVAWLAACEQAPFPSAAGGSAGAAGASATAGAGAGAAPPGPDPLRALYPTAGDFFHRAIVPSCADALACHGGRAAPTLRTFADLEATFGAPCQRTVADPRALVDLCEIAGDDVTFGAGHASFRLIK